MGMDLTGAGGSFSFNHRAWRMTLKLAYKYGWKPRGTKVTEITLVCMGLKDASQANWDGTYFSNMWQEVDGKDAWHLAKALEKALLDVPNESDKKLKNLINNTDLRDIDPLQYWSGKGNKEYLKSFIQFSKKGGFIIK